MYHVHISRFDGPLDLLLHLIESAELDIREIFVSEITTQYLNYMAELDGLDMDTASEFLSMAATLLYIKSRQLLPRPPRDQALEEEDPEALLIRQLHEYRLFRKAGEALLQLQQEAHGMYTRLPEEFFTSPPEVLLSGATLDELYGAFFTIMHTGGREHAARPFHQVKEDLFTVRMQIAGIRERLRQNGRLRFMELFESGASRLEIVVTFMAVLEMLARGEIRLRQAEPFAPISIEPRTLREDDADEDYMDENE